MTDDDRYVALHFWTLGELANATGITAERVQSLIDAGCAPQPIYVRANDGWWSALDRRQRNRPDGEQWFTPGGVWCLRRALVAIREGASDEQAADILRRNFAEEFISALEEVDDAALTYPDSFDGQLVNRERAIQVADVEWRSWLDGGYGVCLRVFTGHTCVAKEALGTALKAMLKSETYDVSVALSKAEALAGIMLPFAPWQRAQGTPGLTIDRLLDEHGLGSELPYRIPPAT